MQLAGVIEKKAELREKKEEIRERQSSVERKTARRPHSREKDHDRWFHDKFTYEEDKQDSESHKIRKEVPHREAYGRVAHHNRSRADRERW